MPELSWSLCALDGTPLPGGALSEALAGGGVTVPLSDGRTFDGLPVSMFDPACALLAEGKTVVKATYNGKLLINGILGVPSADFTAGVVTCSGRDSSIRALNRELRFDHQTVTMSLPPGVGIPVDGYGFRLVLSDMDTGGGAIPKAGIAPGIDTVPAQPAASVPGALYEKVTRGQAAWDVWQNMINFTAGFDVDFHPVDAAHPGAQAWQAGWLCEAITVPSQGVDRAPGNAGALRPVVFVHGLDGVKVVHAPDAFQMKNYAVRTIPGGQSDPADVGSRVGAYNQASWVDYGLWEDWQAVGAQVDPSLRSAVLTDLASAVVIGYATPPQFCTVTCDTDTPGGMVFGTDFAVGDLVGIAASQGFYTRTLTVRIIQVKVVQRTANGGCALEILAVPHKVNTVGILVD